MKYFALLPPSPPAVEWLSRVCRRVCWGAPDFGVPDALLILPEGADSSPLSAPLVVAPGGCPAETPCLVSYGFAAKETVTFSSLRADSCVLSLQREILTLDGLWLERQELPLPLAEELDQPGALRLLGLCAALLTAGCPPEQIAGICDSVLP